MSQGKRMTDWCNDKTGRAASIGSSASVTEVAVESSDLAGAVSMIPDEERSAVLERFNATSICELPECSVQDLISRTIHQFPSGIAASHNGESLTYQQLGRRSTEIANWLIEQGIGSGHVVAVLIDRGLDALSTILGILKAGCAWLPMDPSHPDEHLHFMVQDSRVELVITDAANAERIPVRCAPSFHVSSIRSHDLDDALPSVAADSLAYVIYTSGSTGKPKGVRILHRNLVHYAVNFPIFRGRGLWVVGNG
jgi:non-ribosomal peptide synthetase component F